MADFTLGSGASAPLTDFCSAFEAYGIKGSEGSALRKIGFSKADTNGSGMASLAETENFVVSALQAVHDDDKYAAELFNLFRPSYVSAFRRAKLLGGGGGKVIAGAKTATADDYISFPEFRVFCVYLQVFAALFDVFTTVDGGGAGRTEDDDLRISEEEFMENYHILGKLGFAALQSVDSDDSATSLFRAVDVNGGGFILFREWATHVANEEIKAKTKLGTILSGNLKPTKTGNGKSRNSSTSRPSSVSVSARKKSTVSKKTEVLPVVGGVYKPGTSTPAFKDFLKIFQPYAEKNANGLKMRKKGYSKADSNGSGQCSLAEVDRFVMSTLKKEYDPKKGKKMFQTYRPSYIVAYNGAKNLKSNNSDTGSDEDYINFPEFRILNVYLCVYAGLFDAFSTIDGGGAGVSGEDDRRIGEKEWMDGYTKLTSTGFVGLDELSDEGEATALFEKMDPDKSGKALFSDFCDVISELEIDEGSDLGQLLEGSSLRSRSIEQERPEPEPEEEIEEEIEEELEPEEEIEPEEEPEERSL